MWVVWELGIFYIATRKYHIQEAFIVSLIGSTLATQEKYDEHKIEEDENELEMIQIEQNTQQNEEKNEFFNENGNELEMVQIVTKTALNRNIIRHVQESFMTTSL